MTISDELELARLRAEQAKAVEEFKTAMARYTETGERQWFDLAVLQGINARLLSAEIQTYIQKEP